LQTFGDQSGYQFFDEKLVTRKIYMTCISNIYEILKF